MKYTIIILNHLNIKKINKDNFDKYKKNERKKNMQENTITIYSVS